MHDQTSCHKYHSKQHDGKNTALRGKRRWALKLATTQSALTTWPATHAYKAHFSAFALKGTPDFALISWLAQVMIGLHKSEVQRTRWSGPCRRGSCWVNRSSNSQ